MNSLEPFIRRELENQPGTVRRILSYLIENKNDREIQSNFFGGSPCF